MRRLIFLILVLNIVFCTSCRKDNPLGQSGDVVVALKTVFGGQSFEANQVYFYPSGGAIRFDKLYLYLSDVVLLREDGQEIVLEDISFLDFMEIPTTGWVRSFSSIPLGDYAGIRFGLGVNQEFNSQKPSDFAEGSHPLSESSRYSSEYASYIFSNIGGEYQLDGSTTNFSLFVLEGKKYQYIELMNNFSVSSEKAHIDITFDLEKVFNRTDSTLDIQSNPIIADPGSNMDWISESLKYAFSL